MNLAPPPDVDRWRAPRISLWTEGWRRLQRQPGVSLEPGFVFDFEVPEQQPVTWHWSARPKSALGEIIGYRWTLDLDDILDETPRIGPDDFAHWSSWSGTEKSTTVGPFAAGADPHFFYVEARDDLGFVSLFTVRMRVSPASVAGAEDLGLRQR